MKKFIFVSSLILSLITAVKVYAASVTLTWDTSCNTNVFSYRVYYGITNGITPTTNITQFMIDDCGISRPVATNISYGVYTNSVLVLGRTNNITSISNLLVGTTYTFALTSVDSQSIESDYSTEIIYTIPPATNIYVPPAITGFGIRSVGP